MVGRGCRFRASGCSCERCGGTRLRGCGVMTSEVALRRALEASRAEETALRQALDQAHESNQLLSERCEHWMQQTEAEQEARRREARERDRLRAEADQLRKELAKQHACVVALTEQLQALHGKCCKAVLTARRHATKVFGSVSERLGVEARTAVQETDPACPEWLWDDSVLAPLGAVAEGDGEANEGKPGEAGDGAAAEPHLRRTHKRGRPKGASGGRKIGNDVPTLHYRLEVQDPACPHCGGERKVIRTETAQRLHYVPASYVRIAIERPVPGCAGCRNRPLAQAPAPDWLIPRGLPTEAMLAHLMAAKFQDHLPCHRMAQRLRRHDIRIGDATLNAWLRKGFQFLTPVCDAIREHVLAATRLFLDETTVRFLLPGHGKARIGYLWTALRDDRSFAGRDPPAACFRPGPGRGKAIPEAMLKPFSGLAQVDKYAAYNVLTDAARPGGPVTLQYCLVHWRRKIHQLPASRFRDAVLLQFRELFAIEKRIRGKPPDERFRDRQRKLKPALKHLRKFLQDAANRFGFGKASPAAAAIRYGLDDNAWPGFCRPLEDGRLDLHSNAVENAQRPVKLTQRNFLFAGSEDAIENWARASTLIATCRLNGVDPEAWMTHALIEIRDGCNDVQRLLPWHPLPASDASPSAEPPSAPRRRPTSRLETPPVTNGKQHRKLRSRKTQDTLRYRRPEKAPKVWPLAHQHHPAAVMVQNLHTTRATRAEYTDNSRSRINAPTFPRIDAQRRNPATKVNRLQRKVTSCPASNPRISPSRTHAPLGNMGGTQSGGSRGIKCCLHRTNKRK